MKNKWMLFLCFAFVFSLWAEPFPEFSGAEGLNLIYAEKRSQKILPEPERSGFLLEIDENVFPYAEMHLRNPRPLPDFQEAEFILTVSMDKPEAVRSFSLRLSDKDREIFQFPMVPASFSKGKNRVRFRVGENVPGSSWGWNTKVNKRIDRPVVLTGLTCRIRPKFGRQSIRIHSLELCSGTRVQTTAELPFLFFDNRSKFVSSGRNSTIENVSDGLLLKMKGRSAGLKEYKWSLRPYRAPREILFRADVLKGNGTLQLDGISGKGEKIRMKTEFFQGNKDIILESAENSDVRFQSLTILSEAPETEILFRSSVIRSAATMAEAIRFDVETGNELHILKEGEERKLMFTYTNTSPETIAGKAILNLRDFFGKEITRKFHFSLRPSESKPVPIQLPPHSLGIWNAETSIETETPRSGTIRKTAFAYLRPAGPTYEKTKRDFLFGICSHTARWSSHDRRLEAEAAGLCGAKIVRASSHWTTIQPQENVWNYRDLDELVKLFGGQGIQLQSGFAYTTRWAAPEHTRNGRKWTDWNRAMPDLGAWRKYVSATAARYKGLIKYWEVWNEPDLYSFAHFGAEHYGKLLQAAYEEVKKVSPEAFVMNGGFASIRPMGNPQKDNVTFQKEVLRNGKGFYDIHAHHEHGSFQVYAAAIDMLLLPMRKQTGADAVPWYANETAIASTGGSEHNQALTLFKKLIFTWSRGGIGYNWYDLRNDGYDPYNSEHHYGMMTNDFYPKAVYPVYNALAYYYGRARFVKQLGDRRDIQLYLFRRGNDLLVTGWNEQNGASDMPFVFRTDSKSAERIDIMGNSKGISLHDGTGLFTVGTVPATLYLKDASEILFNGAMIEADVPHAAIGGKPFPLKLKLRNPLKLPLDIQLDLKESPIFKAEKKHIRIRLKPGSEETLLRPLSISSDLPNDFSRLFRIQLNFSIPELNSSGTLDLPFRRAVHIPAGTIRRPADFILDQHSQTFSFWEAQPDKKHLLWRGKNDLSAEIRLSLSGKALNLNIDVLDDVHFQPESGRLVWKGDNVQFALSIPGQTGSWEIGLTRLQSGKSETFIWSAPSGFDPEKSAAGIRLSTGRQGNRTVYRAEIPFAVLGTAYEKMKQGVQFNLLVNDNDGECRKGGIQIAPHLKNAERHPVIVFE